MQKLLTHKERLARKLWQVGDRVITPRGDAARVRGMSTIGGVEYADVVLTDYPHTRHSTLFARTELVAA